MSRPASRTLRLTRVLVALITVWCTGCAGFEPLLNAAFGAGSSMVCAAGMAASDGPGIAGATAPAVTSVASVASVDSAAKAGFSCGCASCHAVTPVIATATKFVPTIPGRLDAPRTAPGSVTRAPLIPPPQRTA